MAPKEGSTTIVLGFREESLPRGHGYLYWRDFCGKEIVLKFCDLNETEDGQIREMFRAALREVFSRIGRPLTDARQISVSTENMSALAQQILQEVVAEVGDRD